MDIVAVVAIAAWVGLFAQAAVGPKASIPLTLVVTISSLALAVGQLVG